MVDAIVGKYYFANMCRYMLAIQYKSDWLYRTCDSICIRIVDDLSYCVFFIAVYRMELAYYTILSPAISILEVEKMVDVAICRSMYCMGISYVGLSSSDCG